MRETIAWSEQLLPPAAQVLFRRLAVFAGGWTLDAAEGVTAGGPVAAEGVLDLLSGLVEHSLVQPVTGLDGEPRYRMLEPIRQYAAERLDASGEGAELRRMHAGWFRKLASEVGPKVQGSDNVSSRLKLETELPNLRSAIHAFADEESPEPGLRVVSSLTRFWGQMGHVSEASAFFERLLTNARPDNVSDAALSNALLSYGLVLTNQGVYDDAFERLTKALDMYRVRDHHRGIASTLAVLGSIDLYQDRFDDARIRFNTALELGRALKDRAPIDGALEGLTYLALETGNVDQAREYCRQMREHHDTWQVAGGQGLAGIIGLAGLIEVAGANYDEATRYLKSADAIRRSSNLGPSGIADEIAVWAQFSSVKGDHPRAARLFGASTAIRESIGTIVLPARRRFHDRALAATRAALTETDFTAAWNAGRAMSPDDALSYALESLDVT